MRHSLNVFLVLCCSFFAGCNVKDVLSIFNNEKARKSPACLADETTPEELLRNGIEVIELTKLRAEKLKITEQYETDPGFDKWLILFHDIPGDPPYSFETKRVAQQIPDAFYPHKGPPTKNILLSKQENLPVGVLCSARGYLPGERVTLRFSGKDRYKELSFYPRPLLLHNKKGELLAKALLVSDLPCETVYALAVLGVTEEEKYTFSQSSDELLVEAIKGQAIILITPEVFGQTGGLAEVKLQFSDNTSYTLDLPWGLEFLKYRQGSK